MSIEAMKLALEALEITTSNNHSYAEKVQIQAEAITDLRQAIQEEALRNVARLGQEIEQEPVAWGELLKEADQIVRSKVVWKRFIDGTPLSNDVPVWMADFAQQYNNPPKRQWVGLTDEQIEDEWERITGHSIFGGNRNEGRTMYLSPDEVIEFARAIESARGIGKEQA